MADDREERAVAEWLDLAWAIEELVDARDRARLWLIKQGEA
ncbi:hypothetical protein ACFQVD_26355 [Streptosporangium amethystogenes subsp. fukuiense]|uniref:Uncharacterized protein n=1 Tax=Streptosporangium amethystogenes subsp. fukuiense TaxID=698418 RepID=A0ABW2T5W8_9ACTN